MSAKEKRLTDQLNQVCCLVVQFPELEEKQPVVSKLSLATHNKTRYSHYVYLVLNIMSEHWEEAYLTNNDVIDLTENHIEFIKDNMEDLTRFYDPKMLTWITTRK